jgi:ankyrin repeat protein
VKLLLDHNAIADFANLKGTTALMRASQEGHVSIAECLLSANADVNRKNHEGMNALMLASQRGHHDIVHLLIRHGAIVDVQTAQVVIMKSLLNLYLSCTLKGKYGADACVQEGAYECCRCIGI